MLYYIVVKTNMPFTPCLSMLLGHIESLIVIRGAVVKFSDCAYKSLSVIFVNEQFTRTVLGYHLLITVF